MMPEFWREVFEILKSPEWLLENLVGFTVVSALAALGLAADSFILPVAKALVLKFKGKEVKINIRSKTSGEHLDLIIEIGETQAMSQEEAGRIGQLVEQFVQQSGERLGSPSMGKH